MQGDGQRDTTPDDLIQAAEIGQAAGLRYIYAGNLPGMVGDWENTRCPQCSETLITRYGYLIEDYRLTSDGRCPQLLLPNSWSLGSYNSAVKSSPALSCHTNAPVYLQSQVVKI